MVTDIPEPASRLQPVIRHQLQSCARHKKRRTTYLQLPRVPRVLDKDNVRQRDDEPNEDAKEGETADTGGPASFLLEDDGEGCEEHL